MYRLCCLLTLTGGVLLGTSAVRSAALPDWGAALHCRACPACGGPVTYDPATHRRSACGDCDGAGAGL